MVNSSFTLIDAVFEGLSHAPIKSKEASESAYLVMNLPTICDGHHSCSDAQRIFEMLGPIQAISRKSVPIEQANDHDYGKSNTSLYSQRVGHCVVHHWGDFRQSCDGTGRSRQGDV